MTVGDQATHQVDQEVDRRAMARVLDLRNVLELIDDRLDNRSFAQKQLVKQRQLSSLHVLTTCCDQLDTELLVQLLEQPLRQIAFIADQLAKQALGKLRYELA